MAGGCNRFPAFLSRGADLHDIYLLLPLRRWTGYLSADLHFVGYWSRSYIHVIVRALTRKADQNENTANSNLVASGLPVAKPYRVAIAIISIL
jgi:hypothetical protein